MDKNRNMNYIFPKHFSQQHYTPQQQQNYTPQQQQHYTPQQQQHYTPQQQQNYTPQQQQNYTSQQPTSFSVQKPPVENLKNTINQRCQSFMFNSYLKNSGQKLNYSTPQNTSINTRIKTLTEFDTHDSLSNNTSLKINRDMEVFNRSLHNNTLNKPINSRNEYVPKTKNYKDIVFQEDKLEPDYMNDAFSGVILSDTFQGVMNSSKASYNSLNRSLSLNNNPVHITPYNRK